MSKGTARRTIRIEDELWDRAQAAAKRRNDNLSEIIRYALREYVESETEWAHIVNPNLWHSRESETDENQ